MASLRSAIRARLTVRRLLLAAALVAVFLALVALLEGESRGAPADNAVRLVPADAVVYVHANVDRDSDQWKRGTALFDRFPRLLRLEARFLRGLTRRGGALNLKQEVEPWLGDEAALALIPDRGGRARSLILLSVSDRALARSFLSRAVGRERRSTYRDTPVRTYGRLSTAFVGRFLAIGQPDKVRASIDAQAGRAPSLARVAGFVRARRGLPDRDRLVFAYASRTGVRGVLRLQTGLAGRLARLADDPDLVGAAAILSAQKDGARVDLSTALERSPSALARAAPFEPRLLRSVSEDAVAYVGMRGADRVLESIAAFAGGAISLPSELRSARLSLQRFGGLRALRRLRPLLEQEAALFVSRSGAVPVITLVVNGIGNEQADELLRLLQPLLARLARRPPAGGQVPTVQPSRVAGLDAATLRLSSALELTYAIFDGKAVIATSPGGIRRVKLARSHVLDNPLFAPGMRGDLDQVTSVLFLDLEQLLALGEQAGLGDSPDYEQLKAELSPVRAVSAITHAKTASKETEIFIEVP
jgi:hypothetical protein